MEIKKKKLVVLEDKYRMASNLDNGIFTRHKRQQSKKIILPTGHFPKHGHI